MKRSKFSLSHYKLMSTFLGDLFPVSWFEALPGDTIQQSTTMLVRSAPIVVPIMHPLHVSIHHWFVPNRIIWANWENFITGGPTGTDTTSHPYMTISGNATVDTLSDYLGIPTENYAGSPFNVSALPFRAYAAIWNEFYRDQDLQTAVGMVTTDGDDTLTSTAIQEVTWEKDYLTTARPWEAKGPAVSIPLTGDAPIIGIGFGATGQTNASGVSVNETSGPETYADARSAAVAGNVFVEATSSASTGSPNIYANLSGAGGLADINTLRHAFAIQRFEEARAKYGSRYVEYLRYLGVRSSDARLQRPEYLGGGRSTMQFSEVLQTGVTSSGTAGGAGGVGQYGGHGITALRSNRYRRFFQEHGIVMTLAFVRPKGIYTQALNRKWLRGMTGYDGLLGTKEDYWQRELQNIGQQQVNGMECDASVGAGTVFGYQDRYDEYRRFPSEVTGQFRATSGGERLDMWNMAREFGSAPSLNASFVACLPSNRGYADLSGPQLYIMANHSIQARRLVGREGVGYVR